MKKTIRLNESDLHRIISESVGQYLTELDWKTYMNASKVAKEKGKKWNDENGENGRSKRFARAAREQFAKDRGYSMGSPSYLDKEYFEPGAEYSDFYIPYGGHFEPRYGEVHVGDNYVGSGEEGDDWYEDDMRVRIPGRVMDTQPNDGLGLSAITYNPEDPIHKKLMDDWEEINNYNRGNYEYRKGEGWKKKNESLDRKIDRIVRESVKHVLSESDYEDYNDWAKNSNASDKEKEDAGKRQDKRREGNSFHGDKLAYKQYRHKQFDERGEDQDNKLALKKRTAKRLRDGWRF